MLGVARSSGFFAASGIFGNRCGGGVWAPECLLWVNTCDLEGEGIESAGRVGWGGGEADQHPSAQGVLEYTRKAELPCHGLKGLGLCVPATISCTRGAQKGESMPLGEATRNSKAHPGSSWQLGAGSPSQSRVWAVVSCSTALAPCKMEM